MFYFHFILFLFIPICFVFYKADPPNVSRIPENDAIGVTVVLLTCSYRAQEFIRVGYFINNEYSDPELRENLPSPPQFDKVCIIHSTIHIFITTKSLFPSFCVLLGNQKYIGV